MDLIENNLNYISILLRKSSQSSLEISQILACVRKQETSLSVWITASLSLSSLHLNIPCSCSAKLWVKLCRDWKMAISQSWKFKVRWEMCAGHWALGKFVRGTTLELGLGKGRYRHNLRGLSRSSTLVTLALRGLRPRHASSTEESQKELALLPSPGGCSALWTGTRQSDILPTTAGWGYEKHSTSLSSHQPNPFKHHPKHSCTWVLHNSLTPAINWVPQSCSLPPLSGMGGKTGKKLKPMVWDKNSSITEIK